MNFSKFFRFSICAKIFQSLNGNFSSAKFKCFLFQCPLKFDPCQHIVSRIILRCYGNHDCTIGIFRISAMIAHSIYDRKSRFRRSIYDVTARAHAKTVNSPVIRRSSRQFIICRRQTIVQRSVLAQIDRILPMFHAHSDGKRLCLHRNVLLFQCLKRISGTMTDGKNAGIARDFFLLP